MRGCWVFRRRLGAIVGCLMKSVIATHNVPHERFVLQFDGRAKSGYRRVADALRAALRLKDEFPQHDIKVRGPLKGAHRRSDAGERVCAELTWARCRKDTSVVSSERRQAYPQSAILQIDMLLIASATTQLPFSHPSLANHRVNRK